VDATELRYI